MWGSGCRTPACLGNTQRSIADTDGRAIALSPLTLAQTMLARQNDNLDHAPGGGQDVVPVLSVKHFRARAQSRGPHNENLFHKPGGARVASVVWVRGQTLTAAQRSRRGCHNR